MNPFDDHSTPRAPFIHPSRLHYFQSGRRSKDSPYAKSPSNKSLSSRISGLNPNNNNNSGKKKGRVNDPRRAPEGTPDVLRDNTKSAVVRREQHSKLNDVLKGDAIRQWLRGRMVAPGVVDMSVRTFLGFRVRHPLTLAEPSQRPMAPRARYPSSWPQGRSKQCRPRLLEADQHCSRNCTPASSRNEQVVLTLSSARATHPHPITREQQLLEPRPTGQAPLLSSLHPCFGSQRQPHPQER